MARRGQCIFLTGAPEAEHLNWDDASLHSIFTIGAKPASQNRQLDSPEPLSWQAPKWRSIESTPKRIEPAYSAPQTQFFSFSAQIPDLDIATKQDFLEHSIALIDNLASSQLAPTNIDDTALLNSTTTTSLSFTSDTSSDSHLSASSPDKTKQLSVQPNTSLTDIKHIPSAAHILSLAPQTITLNLLSAVISVSQPRTVVLRHRRNHSTGQPATMEILDLLVGDETRAGFSVSFWLPPADSQHQHQHARPNTNANANDVADLRSTLSLLRAGDVVFVANVALSVWRGAVYGQSLGRRGARNSTRVERVGDGVGMGRLAFGVSGKVGRVRGWRDEFVGRRRVGGGEKRKRNRGVEEEVLPPDTQD